MCDRLVAPGQECAKPGVWLPVLVMRAPYAYRNSTPARGIFDLKVCDEHKAEAKLEWFLDSPGWAKIQASFEAMGKAAPDTERTTLDWVRVDSEEAVAFLALQRAARRREN